VELQRVEIYAFEVVCVDWGIVIQKEILIFALIGDFRGEFSIRSTSNVMLRFVLLELYHVKMMTRD
jgi:hypothetical protein